jgi:hypothetical protein
VREASKDREVVTTAELEALLFDCLRATDQGATQEALTTLSIHEWTSLIDVADQLMVGPMLRRRLLSPSFERHLPAQVKLTIAAELRRTAMASIRLHADFRQVIEALRRSGIPAIALKGLHLATLVYGDLAVRPAGDIDLLVPAKDLARAGAVLQNMGYKPSSPFRVSHDGVPYSWHHLPRFAKAGARDVEIHWHIMDPAGTGSSIWTDINELWDRAVRARIAGVDAQVLSPEDLLLHLCIHATYGHMCEFSARPWCDVAETIRQYHGRLAWKEVTTRAERWHCRRGVYLALRLARDLVGAAVPDEVLHALLPVGFDDQILTVATRQRHRVRIPDDIARLRARRSPTAKLRVFWNRVLIPTDALADAYNLPRSSRLLYAFYLIRAKDMVKRHWGTVFRLHRGDAALTTLARDTLALREFLAAE